MNKIQKTKTEKDQWLIEQMEQIFGDVEAFGEVTGITTQRVVECFPSVEAFDEWARAKQIEMYDLPAQPKGSRGVFWRDLTRDWSYKHNGL